MHGNITTVVMITVIFLVNYTNDGKKIFSIFQSFNCKYVLIVEELLNEALTTYEKTYEGSYTRRSSQRLVVTFPFADHNLWHKIFLFLLLCYKQLCSMLYCIYSCYIFV